MVKHHKILIFASGTGTNAEQIIRHFSPNPSAEVLAVYSNNPSAFVLERAKRLGVSTHVFNREQFNNPGDLLKDLQKQSPTLIVLAGFVWKVPTHIIDAFPNKIINIHPALLPKYGGKGMYGHHVHQAVISGKETESGISIHYVNSEYDDGAIIFQAKTSIVPDDTPKSLAKKIHKLEHKHFSNQIEKLLLQLRKQVNLYTDGAASGNPGPGGYGLILEWEGTPFQKTHSQGFIYTTNNRMELRAVIKGLQMLKKAPLDVVVYTDSKYVSEAVNKKWVFGWEKNGFKNKKNSDLWIEFLEVFRKHNVKIEWVKGHNQHPQNEHCDKMAVKASKQTDRHIEDFGYQNKG
ncbi:MAG: ribonuclease HI [Legionellales bacterium]|nr:ribonuclease HI [Legionellales bacterium]